MKLEEHLEARFPVFVAAACLLYLGVEWRYVTRLPLAMDEFQGAFTLQHFLEGIPYRDFRPYKTVLGYYVQLPALALAPGPWEGLIWVRGWMALLNATVLGVVALRLGRVYRRAAVALALGLLVTMSTFLERSAVLRLDMLTGLCGLVSLLLLLERRFAMAGLAAGLSFLVSQKGIYFFVAGGLALGTHFLCVGRDRAGVRRTAAFGLSALALWAAYLAIWSSIASFDAVWTASVSARTDIALRQLYQIHHFWVQTISRNPYFWGVAMLALGALWARRKPSADGERDWILATYGAAMLGLCLWHKQPWPYFFVILIPTLFVLAAAFFDAEIARIGDGGGGLGAGFLALYLVVGILLPLTRFKDTLPRDSGFQRSTVEAVDRLLGEGETYLAGVNLVYSRKQSVRELSWLDARRLAWLHRLDEAERAAIVERLAQQPPKLIVDNYRIRGLPEPILAYLAAHYEPLWGNLRIYSPLIPHSASRFPIRFDGTYRVQAEPGSVVRIDDRLLGAGDRIALSAGVHENGSSSTLRLRYLPEWSPNGEVTHREEQPLFPDVYGY